MFQERYLAYTQIDMKSLCNQKKRTNGKFIYIYYKNNSKRKICMYLKIYLKKHYLNINECLQENIRTARRNRIKVIMRCIVFIN